MKNLNLLINRTEGSVCEAQSFVQVNLREGSTRPRQDLEKTSLKGRALSRMSSFMARSWQVAALIMLLLTLGVGQMWADWYISGWESLTGHDWGTNDDCKMVNDKVTFTNRSAAYYQFKLTDGTNWYGHNNLGSAIGTASITSSSGWDNAQITLSVASDVHFYRYNTNYVAVVGVPTTCYVTGNGSEMGSSWCAGKNWNPDASTMTKNSDGTHSIKFSQVPAGDGYKLKVTNGSWSYTRGHSDFDSENSNIDDVSDGTDNNIVINLEALADVTVKLDGDKVIVTIEYYYTGLSVSATPSGLAPDGYPTISATSVLRGNSVTVNASTIPTGYNLTWSSSDGSFGNTSASSTTFTPTADDAEATATYAEKTYNVTVTSNNFSYGTVMSGQTSAQTVSAKHFTSDRTITAEAKSGYRFTGWTKSGSVTIADASATSTTIKATATGATVTANFEALPSGQLDIVAGANGQVKKESGLWGSSASYTDINTAQDLNIYAKANDHYHFVNWTKSGDGSIKTNAESGVYSLTARGSATVTANFAVTQHNVTVQYKCGATTIKASTTASNVGEVTTSSVAAPAISGYNFSSWTVESGVTATTSTSSTPLSIKTNSSGTYTITANYTEDLTSTWVVKGGTNITGNNWSTAYNMTKKTGHSTESVVYYTFSISSTNSGVSGEAADWSFKVINGETWYGLDATGSYWWQRSTLANQALGSGEENIQICADVAGDYEIKVDYSTPASPTVTVTFPTTYQVHYDVGTVKGASDDPSAEDDESNAISDGDYVLSGTEVTFTAEEAATGYTWEGWYDAATTSGTKLSTDDDLTYTTTISAATTVYAVYTENSYTVTVNAGTGGKVSYGAGSAGSSCSASAGVATVSSTIHAIPDAGYAFVGWTNVDEEHHITNFTATWNGTNEGWDLVVNADAATTITANFSPRFALVGSLNADEDPLGGMPGWASEAATTYSAGTYSVSCALTNPNSSYKFQIIDKRAESWAWRGYSDASNNLEVDNSTTYTLSSDKDVYFDSRGVGTYTFTIVEEEVEDVIYPKVKIQDGANSHVVTWGYVTDNGEEGGTITSVVDGEETPNPIASGKYVKDGGSVTVTAKAEDGYRFVDFRTSDTYGEGSQLSTSNPYTVASVTADQNIYAQFAENMCTVTITTENSSRGTITVGGEAFTWGNTTQVGIYTTKGLSVTPAAGYYFSGWTLSATPDFEITGSASDESNTTPTLSGLGGTHGSTGTLTANFVELDKIYFRNINEGTETALWDSVYVGFDPNYWGTGTDCSGGPCGADVQGKTAYKMDKIVGTNIWWAYVPRAFTSAGGTNIVFFNKAELIGHDHFHLGKAAYRGDYRRQLDMFVPDRTKKQTYNETDYYDNGYWGVYHLVAEENVGYYLKDGANTKDLDQFKASSTGGYTYEAVHYINSLDDQYFRIASAGGVFYDANEVTITSSNASTGVMLRSNDDTFTLTPTSEGNYIFRLSQESDSLKLTVIYPVGLGDYRLKHTYTGRNKANSADSTFITYSDVIKANVAGTSATYSMYLNEGGTETLVLQECTGIDGETKLPIWSAGDATNLSGILTKVGEDGNGVYQFDITINTSINKVSEVANIKLYDGPYYIKTDCAPGGWLVYTANPMNKNTANPTAFDYYFVSWIDLDTEHNETKNIKCVIANDYCNAVSDTLRGDGIASIANYGINEPILDNDGSVRFSYNSKTNKLERAYLSGASSLTLETYESGKIYWHETETDQYDRHPGFGDNVLWTYDLTVDAKLGAKAGIRAAWTNKAGTVKEKMLIPTSNMIIDGTGSGTYTMRLVFDFKTNSLMSTWSPNGAAISDQLEDVDVMLVREQQESSDVLSFSGDGSLTPRKMVGCLKFDKADYFGNVSSWTSSTRPLLMFFLSFPFDVKVNDIFGLNSSYGNAFIIRKYDGAERAKKGFFRGDGTTTFWKDLTIADTLHAYEGYLLLLDNEYFNSNSYNIWGEQSTVYLYFPSSQGGTIAEDDITIIVPSHECKLQHYWTEGGKKLYHKYTDSHWNMMGVPVFSNYVGTSTEGTPGAVFADAIDADHPEKCNYFYEWSSDDNNFSIHTAKSYTFKAGHAYLVQYTGEVTFSGAIFTPAAAPARVMDENKDYNIELQVLDEDEEMINRTYVQLRDGASDDFVLNEDVYMASNNRNVEIFTYAGDYDVAANVLSEANHTVEVGVNVHQAGTYTISMPNVFSGTVTLVDTYNQTSTDLSLGDYEVDLDEGTITDRFYLNININKVTTSLENEAGINVLKDGGYHKFIRDDKMFILKNGAVYDAQGRMVE